MSLGEAEKIIELLSEKLESLTDEEVLQNLHKLWGHMQQIRESVINDLVYIAENETSWGDVLAAAKFLVKNRELMNGIAPLIKQYSTTGNTDADKIINQNLDIPELRKIIQSIEEHIEQRKL